MDFSEAEWSRAQSALERHGMNLAAYKRPQLERRLGSFLYREGIEQLDAFLVRLTDDPDLYRRFHTYLTIHVTEFFRDPRYWDRLRDLVSTMPNSSWSVWSAGCSWGAEPVTTALVYEELGRRYEILATDSDAVVLDLAQAGLYTEDQYAKVPQPYRRFFQCQTPDRWRLRPLMRGRLNFRQHNLVTDAPPGSFDLIICRNVIIYFEPAVRSRILRGFSQSLAPGGLLFLGATETFLEYADLGFTQAAPSIYRKDRVVTP